jgi:hypothetical protein
MMGAKVPLWMTAVEATVAGAVAAKLVPAAWDEINAALKPAAAADPNAALSAANALWQNSGVAPYQPKKPKP